MKVKINELKANLRYHELIFKQAAGTSRGILKTKPAWLITVTDGIKTGTGEVSLLPGLSFDHTPYFEQSLHQVIARINTGALLDEIISECTSLPSVKFALETALLSFKSDNEILFKNDFSSGLKGIPINGLIWMGDKDFMKSQINAKLDAGYKIIKLKIGAINQSDEFELLKYLRDHYSDSTLEIRVDANGAFSAKEAPNVLNQLAKLKIHSIEQPIKVNQWDKMAELCRNTPIPIALDEELIGVFDLQKKQQLLETIKPQYLILKPGLLGGFENSEEWLSLQKRYSFDWWATSALESNVGLNAIAQWTASTNNPLPQGLGTGLLYTNNVPSLLYIKDAMLWRGENVNETT